MPDVKLAWMANDAAEDVVGYRVFEDGTEIGSTTFTELTIHNVAPGIHAFEVAAENAWGLGPKSDPVSTPAAASKVRGVAFSIVVNINTVINP